MSEKPNGISFVMRAAKFAADKHRAQHRKDHETPYINHPIEVSEILCRVGITDEEILAGALLHDTIEDTETHPDELSQTFGARVLQLVQECSDDKSLPKSERKRLQVEETPHKSEGAKLIKIADKISNMRDVAQKPPGDWDWNRRSEYLEWSRSVWQGAKGINPSLDELFESVYSDCREKLDTER